MHVLAIGSLNGSFASLGMTTIKTHATTPVWRTGVSENWNLAGTSAARHHLRGRPTVHVGLIENDVRSHVCWPGGQHLLLAHHQVGGVE